MTLTDALTATYCVAFQLCAWPAIARIVRRGSSEDLSLWREGLLLIGVSAQLAVMLRTGADWRVWVSPLLSGMNVLALAVVIRRFRTG